MVGKQSTKARVWVRPHSRNESVGTKFPTGAGIETWPHESSCRRPLRQAKRQRCVSSSRMQRSDMREEGENERAKAAQLQRATSRVSDTGWQCSGPCVQENVGIEKRLKLASAHYRDRRPRLEAISFPCAKDRAPVGTREPPNPLPHPTNINVSCTSLLRPSFKSRSFTSATASTSRAGVVQYPVKPQTRHVLNWCR